MKAVILAAGEGNRFGLIGKPKALRSLLGLPLIKRVILAAREAGIREFCVVTGFRGKEIEEALGDGSKLGVKITYVRNERWQDGNARSVLAARERVGSDKFVLLMSDHMFDPRALKRVLQAELDGGCALCVDKNLHDVFDLSEATKVLVKNGRVLRIGKKLERFNGVDCGIFLCTPEVFKALEQSTNKGNGKLSDAIALLAQQGKVRALDISGHFWFDIDTPADLHEAERRLLSSLPRREDGIVSRYLNRRISARISRRLVGLNISPNLFSILVFGLSVFAAMLFFTGLRPALAVGGILAQVASILDGCDGEIARLKHAHSRYGALLDSVLDRYADALLVLGLVYYGWLHGGGAGIWLLGFAALLGALGVSYTRARYEGAFSRKLPLGFELPAKRDSRMLIIMLGALFNQVFYTLLVLAVLTHAEIFRRLASWRKSG